MDVLGRRTLQAPSRRRRTTPTITVRNRWLWPMLALIIGLPLTGCRGDAPANPPSSSSTVPPTETSAAATGDNTEVERFFTGLAAQSNTGSADMVTAASPGSPADLYARHQVAMRSVLGEGTPAQITTLDGQIRLCHTPTGPEQAVDCVVYADLVTDEQGRVSELTIDGAPITNRVAGPGPVVSSERVTVEQVSAYRSPASGRLLVTLDIANGGQVGVEVFPFAATYRPADGGPSVEADGTWGPAEVSVEHIERLIVQFPDAELGGLLVLTGWTEAGIGVTFPLRVATNP